MTQISVIVPTLKRPTMQATLFSCIGADDVLVEVDEVGVGAYGHSLRNKVLDEGHVKEGYVASIDDDDCFLTDAFDVMRAAIAEHPGRWFLFKMVFGNGSHCPGVTVWDRPVIRRGNVGTPMILAPSSARARWGVEPMTGLLGEERGPGWLGDFVYAQRLRDELGEPVWIDRTIACVRPVLRQEAGGEREQSA